MPAYQIDDIHFLSSTWPLQKDRRPVVFIHGAGQCAAFWGHQIDGLGAVCHPLALDLPGHGASTTDGMSDVTAYARWVSAAMDALSLERPVVCGLSMGGAIAQSLLLENDGRLAGGILVNTGARLRVAPAVFDAIAAEGDQFLELLYAVGISAANRDPDIKSRLLSVSRCRPEVTTGDFTACNRFDVMARLGHISLPVLVVTADQDQLTPEKYGRFMAERIAAGRLAQISPAGHFSPLEKPQALNALITEFVESL